MKVKLANGLIYNDNSHFYYNDNNFMLDNVNYEKDVDNGRCYSCCLRKDCDGKLVRKRISSVSYNQALLKLKEMIPK